ncbi:sulfatase-like hydrolase/transferase [Alisedimentitalea sp. MJ-SS2]|uniref:sulfatase-like hydrolase/transferase n=1 Tax=Aliisedimentitalea sp. MJ-SS2 TaxID=3049795 RepID=UPI00290A5C2D|nr:sulfatase-like hydrolase/transferase [Alisedimentitalea sp. MJ-SS2]MDU8925955.1 sulfatase-like hydrolase/transferase [Alisedimentitalea sp. MJ-SS2]
MMEPDAMAQDVAGTLEPGHRDRMVPFVLWTGVLLGLILAVVRAVALGEAMGESGLGRALGLMARGLTQDWLIVLALTLIFAALLHATAIRPLRRLLLFVFAALALAVLLTGLANLIALRMLGAPLTMDWAAYADMTNTDVVLDYMRRVVSWKVVATGLAVAIGLFGGAVVLTRWHGASMILAILALMAGTVIAGSSLNNSESGVALARFQNPIVAFVASLGRDGGLSGITSLGKQPADATPPFNLAEPIKRPERPAKPLRNVIIFAYESTPANQVSSWGGDQPVTPFLDAALKHALAFNRAYAHVPASNYFLVSIFAALVPELSSISMLASRPDLDTVYLPEVMRANGFRTAFFNSSDNRFQNTEGLVRTAGFEQIGDYRDWECETGVYEYSSVTDKYLNTSSDLCTVKQIIGWIEKRPKAPFFVSFRTGMTHYPYFPGEDPQQFVEDETYNDYLNALRVGDQSFGKLMAYLDEKGLAEETLVVVVGDHGEAFGQHGTYVHAAGIHEENVHIPFALINPQLFSGERTDLIVGIADVGPTITDLMGIATPSLWEGRSVFARKRPDGVMFFSPWNGFLVGYREADEKFIYNGNTKEIQLYDLAVDPGEKNNLAETDPEATSAARIKLGKVIAAHNRYIDWLLTQSGAASLEQADRSVIEIVASGTSYKSPPEGWVMMDGEHVGGFKVTTAPSNAERAVSQEEIDAGYATFNLPVQAGECPRRIELYFLNDEWAGEGKTGDTDLYIRSVSFAGTTYYFNRFEPIEKKAGGHAGGSYRFWRKGGASIDLDLDQSCLGADFAAESTE